MSCLRIFLFGKFHLQCDDRALLHFETRKVQELFSYLLLSRHESLARETLAGVLWSDYPTVQSKKYLRQTLWQLQSGLKEETHQPDDFLMTVEPEWISLNTKAEIWLDVAVFEHAFAMVQGISGRCMDSEKAELLRNAVQLYQGDLLEGWYQDWCLYERERLQNILLAMLDKLIDYCEVQQQYEMGLNYGARVLRYECARERTYQQMMRLHYLAGDRTAALRQYERCAHVLAEELDVRPAASTTTLYQQIREDKLNESSETDSSRKMSFQPIPETRLALEHLRASLADLQNQIRIIELAIGDHT